jgi:hypothetical protein
MHLRIRSSVRRLVSAAGVAAAIAVGAAPALAGGSVTNPVRVPDNPLAGSPTCLALIANEKSALPNSQNRSTRVPSGSTTICESIAPFGRSGFRPLWVMAQPIALAGPTDAFSSTVGS